MVFNYKITKCTDAHKGVHPEINYCICHDIVRPYGGSCRDNGDDDGKHSSKECEFSKSFLCDEEGAKARAGEISNKQKKTKYKE